MGDGGEGGIGAGRSSKRSVALLWCGSARLGWGSLDTLGWMPRWMGAAIRATARHAGASAGFTSRICGNFHIIKSPSEKSSLKFLTKINSGFKSSFKNFVITNF